MPLRNILRAAVYVGLGAYLSGCALVQRTVEKPVEKVQEFVESVTDYHSYGRMRSYLFSLTQYGQYIYKDVTGDGVEDHILITSGEQQNLAHALVDSEWNIVTDSRMYIAIVDGNSRFDPTRGGTTMPTQRMWFTRTQHELPKDLAGLDVDFTREEGHLYALIRLPNELTEHREYIPEDRTERLFRSGAAGVRNLYWKEFSFRSRSDQVAEEQRRKEQGVRW